MPHPHVFELYFSLIRNLSMYYYVVEKDQNILNAQNNVKHALQIKVIHKFGKSLTNYFLGVDSNQNNRKHHSVFTDFVFFNL